MKLVPKRQWRYVTAGHPAINYRNPLSRGLTAAVLPGACGYYNIVNANVLASTANNAGNRASIYGMAKRLNAQVDANTNIVIGTTASLFSAGAMTVMVIRALQAAGKSTPFGFDSATDAQKVHVWLPYSDGVIYFDFGGGSGANRITSAVGVTVSAFMRFIFTAGAAGSAMFVQGTKVASQGTSISATLGANNFGMVYDAKNADTQSITDTAVVACWNRQLSDAEAYSLDAFPFQFMEFPQKKLFAFPVFNLSLTQRHFRFRIDTGAVDAEPTWGAAEDVGQ